ncbi:unnamed protein product [Chrysoparadoxa australica]
MDELDFVYVTDRIVAMDFPADKGKLGVGPTPQGNDIQVVSALLQYRHKGHFMIWNVSEESYDYSLFEDQVLELQFPGHPSPPLGMLFKMASSIESWLAADPINIAVIHCLTGKGRTATIISCLLAWIGECYTPNDGLSVVAKRKQIPPDKLVIPSQLRYLGYFATMMDGIPPASAPLLLRRVIVNTIPCFGNKPRGPNESDQSNDQDSSRGCCPYVQIFKAGKLIFTTSYRPPVKQGDGSDGSDSDLPWAYPSDESIAFPVDCVVQGDLLLRCRHLSPDGQRVSMFRAAFHTGYVPSGVLRFGKHDLDGACNDTRFSKDFFLDLIFAPVEQAGTEEAHIIMEKKGNVNLEGRAAARGREGGLIIDGDSAQAYESMLQRDSKFWEEVRARKISRAEKAQMFSPDKAPVTSFSITDTVADMSTESASVSVTASSKAATQSGGNKVSDVDLLAQLAELEGEDEAFHWEGGDGPASKAAPPPPAAAAAAKSDKKKLAGVTTDGPISKVPEAAAAAAVVSADGEGAVKHASSVEDLPAPPGIALATKASPSPPAAAAATLPTEAVADAKLAAPDVEVTAKEGDTELSALEQLEKELGEMGIDGDADTGDYDFDEGNLDELEGYLESLSGPSDT